MKIEISRPTESDLSKLGVKNWDIWTCEPSKFNWIYSDRETCYILEGKVTVTTDTQTVSFGPGDMVVFPKGLACVWEVLESVRKHYLFG
ncbi:MAG: cupin domain-containing protein [Candidatus Riflebacteria bacterium]|nr:cupin domain-containing protein [Candidatus Riflebacteria bacterium]